MEKIGANYLRNLRQKKGKTLSQVSNECNISVSYLSKIECGALSISESMANRLSTYYGVTVTPAKIVVSYEKPVNIKEPEYRKMNTKLRKENQMLKLELQEINKVFAKLKGALLQLTSLLEEK
jgi:transcriptional regulator with XRE-family HTH domain